MLNQLKHRYIDKQQQKIEKYGFIYDKINKQVIYLTKQWMYRFDENIKQADVKINHLIFWQILT